MTRLKYDIRLYEQYSAKNADILDVDFCCNHFKEAYQDSIEFGYIYEKLNEFCFYIRTDYENYVRVPRLKIFKCPWCGESLVSLPQKTFKKVKKERDIKAVSYEWEEM